jgi:hypothetical protein
MSEEGENDNVIDAADEFKKPRKRRKAEADIDRVVEIERLAGLNTIDFEAARAEAAERMGVRATVLDKEVAKVRKKLGLSNKDEEVGQGRAVAFADPLPWPDPVNGDELATELIRTIGVYAVLRDEEADAIAFWILHPWMVNTFTCSPRLAVTSPTKGCGKTTILRLLSKLTRRSKKSGSMSPPALFRAIEMHQPTLLLDENEKYLESGSDLHALINEGHCKGASELRENPKSAPTHDDDLEMPEFLRRDLPDPHICEQCKDTPDGTERLVDGAWLHPECVRFWRPRENES